MAMTREEYKARRRAGLSADEAANQRIPLPAAPAAPPPVDEERDHTTADFKPEVPEDPQETILHALTDPTEAVANYVGGKLAFNAGKAALPYVGRGILGTLRAGGRRVFGRGNFDDLVNETRGVASAGSPVNKAGARQVAKRLERVGSRSGGPRMESSPPKSAPKKAPKPKPKGKATIHPIGTAQSRVMSAQEQAAAREAGRAVAPTRSPGAMRGASGPELERRAAARARAVARETPAGLEDDLTALLQGSVEAEQAMTQAGLNPAERALVRSVLRGQ